MEFWNTIANGLGHLFWNRRKSTRYEFGTWYQYLRRTIAVYQYLVKKGKKPVRVLEREREFLDIIGYEGTLKTLLGAKDFETNTDVKKHLRVMRKKVEEEGKTYQELYFRELRRSKFGKFETPKEFSLFLHDVWLWRSNMLRNLRKQLFRVEQYNPVERALYTRWDKHEELERQREYLVRMLKLLRARLRYRNNKYIVTLMKQIKPVHPAFLAALKARLIFDDNVDHDALKKLDPDHNRKEHERIYDPLKRDGKKLVRDRVVTENYLKEE